MKTRESCKISYIYIFFLRLYILNFFNLNFLMTLLKKILGADNGEEEMEGLSIG